MAPVWESPPIPSCTHSHPFPPPQQLKRSACLALVYTVHEGVYSVHSTFYSVQHYHYILQCRVFSNWLLLGERRAPCGDRPLSTPGLSQGQSTNSTTWRLGILPGLHWKECTSLCRWKTGKQPHIIQTITIVGKHCTIFAQKFRN